MEAFLEPRDSTCKELQEGWTISHWMGSAIPSQVALYSIMIDSITYSWQFAVTSNNSLAEAWWHRGQCTGLRIKQSGFEPLLWTLCCVLQQDTLCTQSLTPPRCINGYWHSYCSWGSPSSGVASHPGTSRKTPSHVMLNRDKLWLFGSISTKLNLL